MIVVTNRIPVAAGFEEAFEERFRARAGLVDGEPGFVRNEVHRQEPMTRDPATGTWRSSPKAGAEYEVKTWWSTFDDFVAWTGSESFRLAHRDRAPREMFAGPSRLEVHEVVATTDRSDEP